MQTDERIAVASYVAACLPINLPQHLERYHDAAGAADINGLGHFDKDATLGTGFYTYNSHAVSQEYDTQTIFNRKVFFYGYQDQHLNDCVVHSVNFALRGPFFTCREQIIRLMRHVQDLGHQAALIQKASCGVKMKLFNDFVITQEKDDNDMPVGQHLLLSFNKVLDVNPRDELDVEKLKTYLYAGEYDALVVLTTHHNYGSKPTKHSFAITRVERAHGVELLMLDSSRHTRERLTKVVKQQRKWDFDLCIAESLTLRVYELVRKPITDEERRQREPKLKEIMTGIKQEEIKKKVENTFLKNADDANNKKKRSTRPRFDKHRKPRKQVQIQMKKERHYNEEELMEDSEEES